MALTPKREVDSYISILGSDGTLRMTVDENTPGAIKRDWKNADGTKTGTKWELVYEDVSGFITGVEFKDGDFGSNLILTITDGDDVLKLSLSTNSPFGEDMMKKLPAMDLTLPCVLRPYAFTDDKGKPRKGMSITQDGEKVHDFFYEVNTKTQLHGFPKPEFKKDKKTGENKPFSSDDWKLYFGMCRKFLIEYIEEHHLIEPKKGAKTETWDKKSPATVASQEEEINPEDVPF